MAGASGTAGNPTGGRAGAAGFVDTITANWQETVPFGYMTSTSDLAVDHTGKDASRGSLSASFYDSLATPCTFEVVADHCVFQRCTDTTLPPHASAGMLFVHVAGDRVQELSKNFTAQRYQTSYSTIPPWTAGGLGLEMVTQGLTATSPVGTVPRLVATMATPTRVIVTKPLLSGATDADRAALIVTRSAGLDVAWEGASAGSFRVTLSSQSAAERRYVTCRFDPQSGSARLTGTLLERLAAGSGLLSLASAEERIAISGSWRVLMAASTAAVTPALEVPYGTIELR